MARGRLRVAMPEVHLAPDSTRGIPQTVNLPTWMWVDGSGWRPQRVSLSMRGVSVTVTATPAFTRWSMGPVDDQGNPVVCHAAGTPFDIHSSWDTTHGSPDCGYVYRESSAGQSGEAFTIRVSMSWLVTWSGGGESGTFPDVTAQAPPITARVQEIEALTGG